MKYLIEARVVLELEHKEGSLTSKHVACSINLDLRSVTPGMSIDKRPYLDEQDLPTQLGCKALTLSLVQGLVANIHHGQDKGFWNDAEHIRYIIDELQRGFVSIPTVTTGKFSDHDTGKTGQ